uniref:Homeobox-DDT domain protein RLT1 isoform X2 n=1 Tax=Rhizophora mucronata TaxID=61149 RepID=A0A2P2PLQ5_RHIMU
MEGPKCHPRNASDSLEMISHHQQKQKSTSYNYSNSNPGRHSPMDSYDDHAVETSIYSSKGNYKLRFKHDMEAIRSDSFSNHHGCDGRVNTREHMEHWSHDDHSSSPKMAQRNETVSKPSKLVLGSHKSLAMEERSPSSRIAKEDKHYGEMKGAKQYQDPDRVKAHPTNESKVAKRFRVELPKQQYVSKASFPDVLGRSISTKGSSIERPSSFTEDETAETSFFRYREFQRR